MGLGPNYINFESDPDHCWDTGKYERSRFTHLLIIEPFLKNHICLGGGLHSLSAHVEHLLSKPYVKICFTYLLLLLLTLISHFD